MREKAPGRWELRVYAGQELGRKRWVSRVHRGGVRSARKALADLEAEVGAGRARPEQRRKVTVAELCELHIDGRRDRWSPNTLRDRRRIVDREIVPVLGQADVRQVRPLDVERLVAGIARTRPPTARNTLAVLRAAFADGVRWEMVERNSAQAAVAPSVPARAQTAPTVAAVTAVLAELDDDPAMALVVRMATVTGCRRGELAALRWSDIDLEAGRMVVARSIVTVDRRPVVKTTKTGAVKRISLDAGTVAALRAWRVTSIEEALAFGIAWTDDRYVWARRPDGVDPWGLGTFSHRWRALADAHGLEGVRLHDLRHAMVSQLLGDGFDIAVASDRAGHSSRTVTLDTYSHALPDRDREAAEHLGRILDG